MRSELKYYLKDKKYVYYSFRDNVGNRLTGSTKIQVNTLGEITDVSKTDQNRLNNYKRLVDEYVGNCALANKTVLAIDVKKVIEQSMKGSSRYTNVVTVGDILQQFYEKANKDEIRNKNKSYSAAWKELMSIAVNVALTDKLFAKLPIEDLNIEHIAAYQNNLVKKGLSGNTVSAYNNLVISALRKAKKLKWHNNTQVFESGLHIAGEYIDYAVYYPEEELQQFINHEFKGAKDRTRDVFLFGCYTCLRHSDYIRNNYKECIIDNKIEINTKKRGVKVHIPLHPIAKMILEKYDYQLPKIAMHTFNTTIKKVAHEVGFNYPVLYSRTKGGETLNEYKPKYKLTSSHTMRRSFATNAYLSGMSIDLIMKVGGWRSSASFERYLRNTGLDIANMVEQSSFYISRDTVKQHKHYEELKALYDKKQVSKEHYDHILKAMEMPNVTVKTQKKGANAKPKFIIEFE